MHKLHNNHNVYILGAGFSVDRGLPTIKNFMYVMRDAHQWLESEGRHKEANAIAEVLDFRLNAASAAYRIRLDLENIEELFSLASAKSRTLTQKIQLAIASTLDFKLKTFIEPKISFQSYKLSDEWPSHWLKNDNTHISPLSPYEVECPAYEFYLSALLGNWSNKKSFNENSIITFNYDLLVEDALRKLSVPFNYGIDLKNIDTSNQVEVLKLHGSINWGKPPSSTASYVIHNSYDELLNRQQSPQLVPPTWRKIFTGPLRQIWDNSLKSLEKATRIIVIGFSIPPTDNHFKYLIAAGLQNNISLREIVFINPDKEQIEQRVSDLFGDVTKSSSVKVIGYNMSQFLSQGFNSGAIGDFGRSIPSEIQNIYLK